MQPKFTRPRSSAQNGWLAIRRTSTKRSWQKGRTGEQTTDRPAVFTAIYGSYDRLIEPVSQDCEVDWICFTDNPKLRSSTWQIVVQEGRVADPRMSAKWPKFLPHEALPDRRWTVWIDANLEVDSPRFVREALSFARPSGLAVFRHPFRHCIYHEAFSCLRRSDCQDLPVVEQVAHYKEKGFPPESGLYACGVLVRDSDSLRIRQLGDAWLDECRTWSARDQLSFPVVLDRVSLRPAVFPFHIGRDPGLLAVARYLGLTPGTFPRHLLVDRRARIICSPKWVPPLRLLPISKRPGMFLPRWQRNPWFVVRPHRRDPGLAE